MKSIKLINATPHAITIHVGGDETITVNPSGIVPRLVVTREECPSIAGIPVTRPTLGDVEGMPQPTEENGCKHIYIVSALVAGALKREDVYSPGESVRDDKGVVTGCKGLCSYI